MRSILTGVRQQAREVEQELSGRGLPGTVVGAPREIVARLDRLVRGAGGRLRVSRAPRQTATDTQFEFRDGARTVSLLVMARTDDLSVPQVHLEVRAGGRLMERLAVVGAGGPVDMVQVSREHRVRTGIRRHQLRLHPIPRRSSTWLAVEQRSGQRSQIYLLSRGDRSRLSARGADRLLASLGTTTSAMAPATRPHGRELAIRPRTRR